tara:strand:- start:49 stop:609 length:561 start_codon:yes stop_codon:yes gene_type:complete
MTSDPKSIQTLKRFAARFPETEQFLGVLIDAISDPNDRAAVVTSVALLEGAIQRLLVSRLVVSNEATVSDLFGPGGPLRDFSSKIKVAYAIGLVGPKTRGDLDVIREVRNAFAHTMFPVSFEDTEIANAASRVTFAKRITPDAELSQYPPKAMFCAAVSNLAYGAFFIAEGQRDNQPLPAVVAIAL